jgi:hypothetical protein
LRQDAEIAPAHQLIGGRLPPQVGDAVPHPALHLRRNAVVPGGAHHEIRATALQLRHHGRVLATLGYRANLGDGRIGVEERRSWPVGEHSQDSLRVAAGPGVHGRQQHHQVADSAEQVDHEHVGHSRQACVARQRRHPPRHVKRLVVATLSPTSKTARRCRRSRAAAGECLVAISGKAFGSWRRGDAPLDCARQGVGVQSQDCEDRAANGARAPGPGGRVLRLSAVSDACSVDWSSTGISWQVRPRSASGGFCAGQEQQTYCGGEGVGAANTGG